MEPLTEKQKRVLNFIEREVERCNYPPSVREICKALGISSTATVHSYLDILENKGYISRMATKPRAIKLLNKMDDEDGRDCVFVPLIGRITAGQPILAEENREGYFPVPEAISNGNSCFALRVAGDSMKNAGIFDGDYVIIKQQSTAENGDIIAALLGDEATVKRFYREKDYIRLQPENDAYAPIMSRDVKIIGKVVGLFRKL
ncbi:MAG: transcriptional repressor LexA [Bacillota bacterium]|nr:transcriptional repressor LexA [Bacillota bacterium]